MKNSNNNLPSNDLFSITLADDLVNQSQSLINQVLSGCDIPTPAKVELTIPNAISSTSFEPAPQPGIDNYFNQAEQLLENILNEPNEDNPITGIFGQATDSNTKNT